MDGDLKIQFDPEGNLLYEKQSKAPVAVQSGFHFDNLANKIEERTLDTTTSTLTELISHDESAKGDWEQLNADAYKLLGVGPESEADDADEDGMSDTSDHPLLLTAIVRYLSKALAAVLPSDEEAIRYKLAFDPEEIPDRKERHAATQAGHEAGRRVDRFYAHYLFEAMPNYEEDFDHMLFEMGMTGVGVKKVYTDMSDPVVPVKSCYVPMSDIFVSYDAKNFRTGRIAHRMNMPTPELIRLIQSGQYRAVAGMQDSTVPVKDAVTEEKDRTVGLSNSYMEGTETHRIYEVHCELFLSEDAHPQGFARPYIVTIHSSSMEILSIVRNWKESDPNETRIEHFCGYLFHPGKSGVYGMGLGHLLANVTRALRKGQRRGLEAAYLQNHPSGFKLSNFKIRNDATKIRSGEFRDVDSPAGDIRQALMVQPFEGPSPGLIQLMEKMEGNGKQLGGLATQDLDNLMKAGMAAGPAMAAIEEATEFQTAIHRRLYRGHKLELNMIHERLRELVGQNPLPFGSNNVLHPGDLHQVDVRPRMKPGQASKQKVILEDQAVLDLSSAMPDIVDKRKAATNYLRSLGKVNLDEILVPDPAENPPQPRDPASEYGQIMAGHPVAVGPAQNHMAHVEAHASQMQGLQTAQIPVEQGDAMLAALAAHIAEHYAMDTMVKVATMVGIPLEQLMEGLPPEMETQIAPQIAEAIAQIEAERAPPEQQEESKSQVEAVKGQNAQALQLMKNAHDKEMETMQQRHEKELQRQRDDAEMARAVQDDETALEIANMEDPNKDPARAGTVGN